MAHLALDEAAGGHDLPRWFHEGFAVHIAGEDAAVRAESLCLAALHDRLLGLREVDARFPDGAPGPSLAIAEAADFVRFLLDKPARERFPALIERLRAGEPLDRALPAALGSDLDGIEVRWRKEMARRYSFVPVFVGATLLWVVVALGIGVRRRRMAATRRAASERRPLASAARLSISEPPEAPRSSDPGELSQAIPPDPEVPKIEHGGRWYTLH
ncbi:MAG: peptidase MA family metallohydrolase [Minicystis sp.]